jgi:hypothetical protein
VSQRNNSPWAPARDPRLALDSADAFRGLAQQFLSSIRQHVDLAWRDALNDLGGLVASATNLTLAVELYLKTLYILLRVPVPHTHNLLQLFSGLPQEVEEALTRAYDAMGCPSPEVACGITLQLSVRPLTDDDPRPEARPDHGLRSVLDRGRDAFETWRYLYERADQGVRTVEYEFRWLDNAATVFRAMALERLGVHEARGSRAPRESAE